MMQAYSDPRRASDPHALPDIEVWHVDERTPADECPHCLAEADEGGPSDDQDAHETDHCGWYWWSCFPGCLPDGEPNGPFETEAEALADAREGVEVDDDEAEMVHERAHAGVSDPDACDRGAGCPLNEEK